jgi:hypothetical protein
MMNGSDDALFVSAPHLQVRQHRLLLLRQVGGHAAGCFREKGARSPCFLSLPMSSCSNAIDRSIAIQKRTRCVFRSNKRVMI